MGALTGVFSTLSISASALTAERLRMDVISNNIANANTTRTIEGGPYVRQRVVFAPRYDVNPSFAPMLSTMTRDGLPLGVRATGVVRDPAPPRMVYDPGHPDANAEGYVSYPNVNIVNEMVDMISATRAYDVNVSALNASKSMALRALEIGRG
jgi:flagellar basal-body rod protein FlgC